LNFGNPFDPQVYYQFVHAVKGMGEACRKFDTPVTGGNVSFYNQSPDGPVYPTPTIGMVGLVEDLDKKMTLNFKEEGDIIYVLGELANDINSSEYLHKIVGVELSPAPAFDLEAEFALQQKVAELIKQDVISSAHDISEGGLFVTLCEKGFTDNKGFEISTDASIRKDAFLFGEAQSRIVVSVTATNKASFERLVSGIPCKAIGKVTGGAVQIDGENWNEIGYWKDIYLTTIERHLSKDLESEGALTML
jgi:phosphoribosylformylglycinamidine synthase subunit PurL